MDLWEFATTLLDGFLTWWWSCLSTWKSFQLGKMSLFSLFDNGIEYTLDYCRILLPASNYPRGCCSQNASSALDWYVGSLWYCQNFVRLRSRGFQSFIWLSCYSGFVIHALCASDIRASPVVVRQDFEYFTQTLHIDSSAPNRDGKRYLIYFLPWGALLICVWVCLVTGHRVVVHARPSGQPVDVWKGSRCFKQRRIHGRWNLLLKLHRVRILRWSFSGVNTEEKMTILAKWMQKTNRSMTHHQPMHNYFSLIL